MKQGIIPIFVIQAEECHRGQEGEWHGGSAADSKRSHCHRIHHTDL